LLTYGFEIGTAALPFQLSTALSYTGFTNRGDKISNAFRYDSLDFSLAWNGLDWSFLGLNYQLVPAFGISLYGNLSGFIIQESWHNLVSIKRSDPAPKKRSIS
jgi:hypothetical protein